MKHKSQNKRIAEYLSLHSHITTAQAIAWKWTTKLSTRIGEIQRATGITIDRERIPWGDTYGTKYSISAMDTWEMHGCVMDGIV